MVAQKWLIRLGAAAELDFANIVKWTTEQFGARQSRIYRNTLLQAIGELAAGSDIVGSKARDEVIRGLRTLHVARHGRRGSHFLMYRVAEAGTIEIIRILHDRMDLSGTFLLRTTIAPNSRAESRNRPVVEEDYGEPEHKLRGGADRGSGSGPIGTAAYDPIPEVERPILL